MSCAPYRYPSVISPSGDIDTNRAEPQGHELLELDQQALSLDGIHLPCVTPHLRPGRSAFGDAWPRTACDDCAIGVGPELAVAGLAEVPARENGRRRRNLHR